MLSAQLFLGCPLCFRKLKVVLGGQAEKPAGLLGWALSRGVG